MTNPNAADQPTMAEQAQAHRERIASAFGAPSDAQPMEQHIDAGSVPQWGQRSGPASHLTNDDLEAAVAPLMAAIQDLQARVAALERRIGGVADDEEE